MILWHPGGPETASELAVAVAVAVEMAVEEEGWKQSFVTLTDATAVASALPFPEASA